jgi:DNA-binding HxlR family transcriptional regulator
MQKEAYRWLIQGKRRKKIIAHLKQPMTAKQLAQTTGIREDCCSYVLQELSAYRLVYCLNPEARRSRLYWLTNKCKQYQEKILKTHGLPIHAYDFPIVDWKLYGWICYSHRAAIIKAITESLQPASIRRKIKRLSPDIKISANNVADILRLFLKKGIIKPVNIPRKAFCRYELTELGNKLQTLLCQVEKIS